jgi:NhaA family Na+:H+ antiporter
VGITFFSWIAVRVGIADLPFGVSWLQLFSASWLAGVGFTMSLFIASSAFQQPQLLALAKMDILVASVIAAAIGFVLIAVTSPSAEGASKLAAEGAVA